MDGNLKLSHSIGLEGIQNARELGGYMTADGRQVKHGVLLRTARLSTGSAEDLRRLSEEFHLAKIFDFRGRDEIEGSEEMAIFKGDSEPDPDPAVEGAEYLNLPILDLDKVMEQNRELMKHMTGRIDYIKLIELTVKAGFIGDELYFDFLDGELGKASYSRMFRELLALEEGKAALFHCTQGKDRTGVAAMLILSVLGVPEKTIVEDYMLTNTFNADRIAMERMMLERSGKVPAEMMDTYLMAMDKVNEDTMTNVIAHVKERCGTVIDYIKTELGVTDEEVEQLKDKFLE